jgi:hypothetical protein
MEYGFSFSTVNRSSAFKVCRKDMQVNLFDQSKSSKAQNTVLYICKFSLHIQYLF